MGLFDCFPLSNAYSVNLDWIMRKIKELEKYVADYTAINNIAYAGVWDITKQYPKWALVTNGDTSYLSLQPVPVGIPLENADYWQKLADLDPRISGIIVEIDKLQQIIAGYEIVNVKSFGAKGDGLTDDSDAIQNAVDASDGKPVYFPSGTYNTTKTILIPNYCTILGTGVNSVVKVVADVDGLKSKDFDTFTAKDPGGNALYITISDIVIDGGYYSDADNFVKSGKTLGSGLKLWGNNFKLENVYIVNFPEYGIVLRNAKIHTRKQQTELWFESILSKCKVGLCGKDGINTSDVFDFEMDECCVHTCGQAATNYQPNYANVRFISGNAKIVNCHFSSLYGPTKPFGTLLMEKRCGIMNVSNSHIEGAYYPLLIYSNNSLFSNCTIYGSFGECDVILHGSYNSFVNCSMGAQIAGESSNPPAWLGAFIYGNNCRCNSIDVELTNTKLHSDTSALGFLNSFVVRGYCPAADSVINAVFDGKATYNIRGDFGDDYSDFVLQPSKTSYYSDTLPSVKNPQFVAVNGDTTTFAPFIFISSYTEGTLSYLPFPCARGSIAIVYNNTNTDIPFNTGTYKVNSVNSGKFKAKTMYMLFGISNDEYVTTNLA